MKALVQHYFHIFIYYYIFFKALVYEMVQKPHESGLNSLITSIFLWSLKYSLVVSLFEEVKNAPVNTPVDATLPHAGSHPAHCLKYVHFLENVALCLQTKTAFAKRHLRSRILLLSHFYFLKQLPHTVPRANRRPLNITIILSRLNLSPLMLKQIERYEWLEKIICLIKPLKKRRTQNSREK